MSDDWNFRSTPKIDALSHRTVAPGETLARVRAHASRIPITRLSDLTPLDRLRLPVYSATTPLARDLTIHMGKGLNADTAQVSAMMEAVERVSAEQVERPTRRLSFRNISEEVSTAIDPRVFDLPDDSSFGDDRPIAWIDGWDLIRREIVWLPLDLAISPAGDGVLCHVDTNGLAAGNTLLEAVVHALCEVIERDALGLFLFRSLFADAEEQVDGRRIAPESLPPACREWSARIAKNDLSVETELLDCEVGIAVFRSVVTDHGYPCGGDGNTRRFVGLGASPNAAVAVTRSVMEAVQSRVAAVQAARDSFNTLSASWRPSIPRLPLRDIEARSRIALADIPTFASDDLREDLSYLLNRVTGAGFDRVIAVNLSRRDFGMPVVRIRVPGLTSFAVNRRRLGWRCLRYLL
jgi:ribosomal protein S12 methylthiotransferase accessory factor